jgi:hypothetical protein
MSDVEPLRLLPTDWYPDQGVAYRLQREYGQEVDLRLILEKFRAYHTEGQVSRNWDSRFVVWVIRDVQQVREKHKGGTDELGNPLTQSKGVAVGLQPGDDGYVSLDDLAADAVRVAEEQPDD